LTRTAKRLKIPPFLSGQGKNDLEPVVTSRHPEVAAQLAWLRKAAPQARMTGSGACMFAEFATEAQAAAIQARMPAGYEGFVTRGLGRHPLFDWTS
jgi:4-diphosphocytidyl-2-C-methyl-D-erythritol kinase